MPFHGLVVKEVVGKRMLQRGVAPETMCRASGKAISPKIIPAVYQNKNERKERMKRKRIFSKLLLCAAMLSTIGTGVFGSVPLSVKAAGAEETYEAKIGGTGYEELEEAFANAQAGDTITVLKDCSVSKTLVVTADNITLTSGDSGNPVSISRDEEFAGKNYNRTGLNNVLLSIEGSLTMRDIILDGGAVLDEDFNNSGQTWDSPLVYVKGTLAVENGTILQNNYNTDGNEKNNTNRSAGAIHVASGSTFTMSGGLIQRCYTNGSGGGIQTVGGSVTITSGTITECNAYVGGAMEFIGSANVSGMTISGNRADAAIVSINGEVTLSDCLIKDNKTTIGTGAIGVSMYSPVTIEGCTITGNHGWSTSAISYSGTRTAPLTIRDCTIRGNVVDSGRNAAIEYMTKAPLILDGQTVIEDNTVAGGGEWDIYFYYNDTEPIKLGSDFESDSTFVMWGYNFTSGTLLVDAASNGKEADASQFVWRTPDYRTEEKEGNIYLAEIPVTYRVIYNANNNPSGQSTVASDPTLYTSEDTVVIMDRAALYPYMGDIVRPGYDFIGWNTRPDGDGIDYAPGQETSLTGYLYLYAKWERAEATVTFDADGGTMEGGDVIAKIGDSITLPDCTKAGYEFVGWYDGDSCVGQAGEEYTVSDDVTLKAHYEKKETETVICTVTFDADGGETARKSISAEKGSTIILPACSKTGYEFLGWFLASDNNTCAGQAGEEFTVQGDITLKAHFRKKEAVKVTITFDADGGKEVKPITAAKGETIRLPKTEKEGYSFLGWYTEKDGGILLGIPGSEMKAVKDMTAYALWEKDTEKDTDNDADPETCKVTFHAGKGTIKVKELTIIKDGSLYLPMPEREGYDFAGWYLDDALTQFAGAYHDTYRITRDTDFYAKWEKTKDNSGNNGDGSGNGTDNGDNTQDEDNSGETLNTYTIKYDANGGKTKNASVKVVIGGSVKLPGAEREGYTFKGWYTDSQVFIGTEGETYKPSRSISLYARWEKTEDDGKNDQDSKDKNSTENTNDKNDKNTSDKSKNTSGTVSGNSVDSPSDKDTDTKTEGGNGNAGKGTAPVIQTGHASPFYLLAVLGLCGIMLAAVSVLEGKKSTP